VSENGRTDSEFSKAGELIEVVQELSGAQSLEEVQRVVRTAARSLVDADGATFVLRDDDHCYYADEDAISPLWKGQRFPLESCISGWAMLNRHPAVIPDIYADERIPHDAYRPTFVQSLVMVPIRQADPLGAIGCYWAERRQPGAAEVRLISALADATAVAIESVYAYNNLQVAHEETLIRLALAAEFRGDGTIEHTQRVARVAALIAERAGADEEEVERIRQAAPLHDIGKLAVPESVLLKPGPLDPNEREAIEQHPGAGASILAGSRSDTLKTAAEIAHSHHEDWDGGGYPHGLSGEEIPFAARVTAIADVFDALTHERSYKEAWPLDVARDEISSLAGRKFDPELCSIFANLTDDDLVGEIALAEAAT
jgi:putative two-component system response regulator